MNPSIGSKNILVTLTISSIGQRVSFDLEYLFFDPGTKKAGGVSKVGRGIGGCTALPHKAK